MSTQRNRSRRGWIARTALLYLAVVLAAFAIGTSGLPGRAIAAVAQWLTDGGHVQVTGPAKELLLSVL